MARERRPEEVLGHSGSPLGAVWVPSWAASPRLRGASWAVLGRLGAILGRLGAILGRLRAILGSLEAPLGLLRGLLKLPRHREAEEQKSLKNHCFFNAFLPPGARPGASWRRLRPSGMPLGPSCMPLGGHLGPLGAIWDAITPT